MRSSRRHAIRIAAWHSASAAALCLALLFPAAFPKTGALAADRADTALRFERVELSPHDRVLGAALRDLDGDGRPELLIASAQRLGNAVLQRYLTVYRWQEPGAKTPEVWKEFSVPDDAVAYTAGDLLGSGRSQILYLAPTAVFALDLETAAVRKLAEHRLIATLAAPQALPFWDGLRDLDGDARPELILPDASGYVVYRVEASGALARASRIDAGSSYASEPLTRVRRRIRSEAGLVTQRAVNQVGFADVNADQRLDLVTMDEDQVLGFAQADGLRFANPPTFRRSLILPGGDPFGDVGDLPAPEVQLGDINGDGRADFVVPEVDVRELVTRLRVFLSGANGPGEQPSQILKLSSLGSEPELADLNGDGRLDLGCSTVRTDRLRTLTNPAVLKLDFTYYAFLFRAAAGAFSTRPDVQWDISIEIREPSAPVEQRDEERSRAGFVRMSGDFNGDGVGDLARLGARGEITVFASSLSGTDRMQLRIAEQPMLTAQERPTDGGRILDADGDGRSDVALFYEESLVLLVTRG
jgi:hypothetical protein